jgi:hypothetical protein
VTPSTFERTASGGCAATAYPLPTKGAARPQDRPPTHPTFAGESNRPATSFQHARKKETAPSRGRGQSRGSCPSSQGTAHLMIVAAGLEVDAPAVRWRRYLRAMRLAALVAALWLVPVSAASALEMGGNAKPRHWNWARAASVNVPLPDERITLSDGHDPEYLPEFKMLLLPSVGRGKYQESYRQERYLFLHELGHVYDFANLRPADRTRFKRAVGTSCAWRAKRCRSWNWSNESVADVSPSEMFAEMYAACALGLTRLQVDEQRFYSYGWMPPLLVDQRALCAELPAR